MEKVGGVAVKTYDYAYDALNRMTRSTKTLASVAPGTAGNWTGAMTLASATPNAVAFAGGDAVALSGDFSATFDPGTLQVFVSEVQGVRDESSDYPATLQGYTGTQIDALAPALPHQGTFDLYASALDGATRVYSNSVSITYGPQVREYDLDGAGNRNAVETSAATATYAKGDDAPYLIHAHFSGPNVVVRRGQLGQPLETVLVAGRVAPLPEPILRASCVVCP